YLLEQLPAEIVRLEQLAANRIKEEPRHPTRLLVWGPHRKETDEAARPNLMEPSLAGSSQGNPVRARSDNQATLRPSAGAMPAISEYTRPTGRPGPPPPPYPGPRADPGPEVAQSLQSRGRTGAGRPACSARRRTIPCRHSRPQPRPPADR